MSNSPSSPKTSSSTDVARHVLPSQLLHELRTPLNQIIGYSEMLAEQAQDEGQSVYVADLHKVRSAGLQLLATLAEKFVAENAAHSGSDETREATGETTGSPAEKTGPIPNSDLPTMGDLAAAEFSSGAQNGLILVVDDNETNRDVLTRRLQHQGYQTASAENGQQALEILRRRPFDLVLLDIMMPEMDGYEVLRIIKEDDSLRYLPVIMISALNEMDSVVRCIEMGAEDYLTKPFNATLLKARVGACLGKKRGHDREVQLYTQLQQNFQTLQQLEKMRDDLTHMIVHDLRTPLSSLLGGLQTMPLLMPIAAEQKECYDIALRGGKSLLSMINDLLDISKMESGTFALTLAPLSVATLLDESIEQIISSMRNKELALLRQIESELPDLSADADKLRRVLVNLLGNALKFTPHGGTITVAARPGENEDSASILFAVSDTGEGIPPEAFAQIFEKFGQVESRSAGRQMSTGLGLTFCKMAVEAHGGRIWVESTLGQGSTFFFTMPLDRVVEKPVAIQ